MQELGQVTDRFAFFPIPVNLTECFYIMPAHDAQYGTEIAFCKDERCLQPFVHERRQKKPR